jgi:AbrB family looped-hinge helix DNA binding protein
MSRHSVLSAKGQVTIPKEIRERLGLEPGDFVVYEITDNDKVILRRVEPYDAAFHLAVSETLEEWGSEEDDEAFRDL